MPLVPNDLGLRMRMLTESGLLEPSPSIAKVASDAPNLAVGQRFSAQIRDSLPENTYLAVVAGKSLTLRLPEGAKTGDTLELVVVDRSDHVVHARVANATGLPGATPEAPAGSTPTSLSSTARLISQLLPEGEPAPPAPLSRGTPVILPNMTSAAIANKLAEAVDTSGLFYESHQAQWISGQRPLATLLQEPQAQLSNFATLISKLAQGMTTAEDPMAPRVAGSTEAELPAPPAKEADVNASPTSYKLHQETLSNSVLVERRSPTDGSPANGHAHQEAAFNKPTDTSTDDLASKGATTPEGSQKTTSVVAPEVRGIVQQQLDALATQRMVWHGEIWPNQFMEWRIEHEARRPDSEAPEQDAWLTQLRLELPQLGPVSAQLRLGSAGLTLTLRADDASAQSRLQEALPELDAALTAAGIPLRSALVMAQVSPDGASDSA